MSIYFLEVNGHRIAPFKYPNLEPYGVFTNTTAPGKYPILQTIQIDGKPRSFNWPSSEHAYHAQKLIYMKNDIEIWKTVSANDFQKAQQILSDMLSSIEKSNKEYNPSNDFRPLLESNLLVLHQLGIHLKNKADFDKQYGSNYPAFMRLVIQNKLEQHEKIRHLALDCAKHGIIPVEVSRHDNVWASGADGEGKNQLGILILEEANQLLIKSSKNIKIPNPHQAYKQLQQPSSQPLSHDNLLLKLDPTKSRDWIIKKDSAYNNAFSTNHTHVYYNEPQLVYNGNNKLNGEIYYKDIKNNLALVIEKDGNSHFSQRISKGKWLTILVPAEYQKKALECYKEFSNNKIVHKPNNHLIKPVKFYYHYSTDGSGRKHFWSFFKVKSNASKRIGDALKTEILGDFKTRLENCNTVIELEKTIGRIKNPNNKKMSILRKGQGLFTIVFGRFFSIKTSSEIALDNMIIDIRKSFQ